MAFASSRRRFAFGACLLDGTNSALRLRLREFFASRDL
jgi:hypothetical protein